MSDETPLKQHYPGEQPTRQYLARLGDEWRMDTLQRLHGWLMDHPEAIVWLLDVPDRDITFAPIKSMREATQPAAEPWPRFPGDTKRWCYKSTETIRTWYALGKCVEDSFTYVIPGSAEMR